MSQPYPQPCDRGVIEAAPQDGESSATRKRWILAACILASSMAFIDGSALTVALPALRADFGADYAAVQWVINWLRLFSGMLFLQYSNKTGDPSGDERRGRARIISAIFYSIIILSHVCASPV
jgi:MFS family permease